MRWTVIALGVALCCGCSVRARLGTDQRTHYYPPYNGPVCLLAGGLPGDVKFEPLGKIIASKRSYGHIENLYEPMAREARKLGAEAIINLQAEVKLKGPLPWRITAPTGNGQAVKILPDATKFDCQYYGGRPVF